MKGAGLILGLFSLFFTLQDVAGSVTTPLSRQFGIDYNTDQFLLDGQPFRYVAGSLHYFRVVRASWRDRLQKMRAAGLNAVSTYVEWSQHEPSPGTYLFEGDLDLVNFINTAQEEGLLVILRPGPYICAERDFGGFPAWLLTVNSTMNLRSYDDSYRFYADKWLTELMTRIQPLLYGNGGPIIMVQVENEYGSFDACDFDYTTWLRDRFLELVDGAALLFTTDGAGNNYLRCGKIQDVFATVDFGGGGDVDNKFRPMRNFQPRGPLVNSEFYPGWLSHWEEEWQRVDTETTVATLNDMLLKNASVNFYVFAGGTNFGFTSGANYGSNYQPSTTSYDYDAPLTEAGDPTEKYLAIRNTIGKFMELPDVPVPEPSPKGKYASVHVKFVARLFEKRLIEALGRPPVISAKPLTFEEMGQRYGFALYETTVPSWVTDPALLAVPGLADRAIVYVEGAPVGILSRARHMNEMPLFAEYGQKLQLFVENQGRINYGSNKLLKDFKGILSSVKLNNHTLKDWTITGFPLDDVSWVENQPTSTSPFSLPAFLRGEFTLPAGTPLDTFLDMSGFGKGVAYMNGHNLGRYWPKAGPISTLYVPASFLLASPAINKLVLFEMENVPSTQLVHFVTEHIILSTKLKTFAGTA